MGTKDVGLSARDRRWRGNWMLDLLTDSAISEFCSLSLKLPETPKLRFEIRPPNCRRHVLVSSFRLVAW